MSEILSAVAGRLAASEPAMGSLRRAAVSVTITEDAEPTVLLIKRAESPGDPWSGQIAFPGGKTMAGDASAMDTAVRETMEEVGIDLGKSARFLGYARPLVTHTGTMHVVPCVFTVVRPMGVTINEEVATYRWVRLKDLLAPEAKAEFRLEEGGERVGMPAFSVGDFVVWGLTHRIISTIFVDSSSVP